MYEDYLENFVFKTAKLIAIKLFGREKRSKNASDKTFESKSDNIIEKSETDTKELIEKPQDAIEPPANEQTDEDREQEAEINRMLEEAMEKQRLEKAKKDSEAAAARAEYDAITEGLSEINFHLPLLFLLVVITILSLPSVVTWAKNYHYARILSPDPMLFPATGILIALGAIWQLNTPRDL